MSRKTPLTPRKVPRQDRARATVDAILIATRRLLIRSGYDSVTTNEVADVAGVSIGTLYQYFPSIDSIVTLLFQGLKEELQTALGVELVRVQRKPMDQVADGIVDSVLETYRLDVPLHALLCELAPRIGAHRKVEDSDAETILLLQGFLETHPDVPATLNPKWAALTLFCALDGVTALAAARGPEWLDDP